MSVDCWNELVAPVVSMELIESTGRAVQNGCCFESMLSVEVRRREFAVAVVGWRPAISIVWVGIELKPLMNGSVPLLMIRIAGKLLSPFVALASQTSREPKDQLPILLQQGGSQQVDGTKMCYYSCTWHSPFSLFFNRCIFLP